MRCDAILQQAAREASGWEWGWRAARRRQAKPWLLEAQAAATRERASSFELRCGSHEPTLRTNSTDSREQDATRRASLSRALLARSPALLGAPLATTHVARHSSQHLPSLPAMASRGHRTPSCLAVAFWLLVALRAALANEDAKRLYDDLLNGYNSLIRPVGNNSDRLTVKMGLKLSQLIDVVSASCCHVLVTCLLAISATRRQFDGLICVSRPTAGATRSTPFLGSFRESLSREFPEEGVQEGDRKFE